MVILWSYQIYMSIFLSTTDSITGYKVIKTIGIVCGEEVIATSAGEDFVTDWKAMFGGKLKKYRSLMTEARISAEGRIIEEAESVGADAIIGVKYSSSSIMQGASEIMVYGTAVQLEKVNI